MRLACALAVALPLLCGSHAHASTFQGLGHLPGGTFSYAMAVSADGSTIVGEARHDGNVEAWVAVLSEPSTGPAALPAVPPWGGPLLAVGLLALGVSAIARRAQ